jgi:hypothetical protein
VILSVPSYVIPGTYGENVEFLARIPEIRAVELLFYYFDPGSRDLFVREKELIASYRGRFDFGVHMPEPLHPEHEALIELTRDLCGRYILHPPPGDHRRFGRFAGLWRERYGDVFLIENLIGRDFSPVADALDSFPLCCDTGHLLRSGADVGAFFLRYGARIAEIHLHGVIEGADHRSFSAGEAWFRGIVPFLRSFPGVVNLEVFSEIEVRELIEVLRSGGVLREGSS